MKKDNLVDVFLEDIDENKFNDLIEQYLVKTYRNVDAATLLNGSVDDKNSKIFLECLITFKDNRRKKTSFIFEAKEITKRGNIKFIGLNEDITDCKKPYTLIGKVVARKLLPESLAYKYTYKSKGLTESKKISGREVIIKTRV